MLAPAAALAQSNVTKPMSFNIVKEVKPPILNLDMNSVKFVDTNKNNALDANESSYITFTVGNSGMGDALNCTAAVTATGTTSGLLFSKSAKLNVIKKGEKMQVTIPVSTNMQTEDGKVDFAVRIDEPNGFGTDPFHLTVNTKAFVAPMLKITDHAITGTSSTLQKKIPFNLQLLLQNVKYGDAENVDVTISVPENVYILDGNKITHFDNVESGKVHSLEYTMIANNNYAGTSIPVDITIREKFGRYSENKHIDLDFNQNFASGKIAVNEVKTGPQRDIRIASIGSAVDKNIPGTSTVNDKTFAVIIANENYQNASNVPFAINDGGTFRSYCEKTLGIPQSNIRYVPNATLNNILGAVSWLENVMNSYEGQAKAIFYYAGHGIPDEASKDSYLLPVDGIGSNVRTGYKLQNLYASLGKMPSKSTTVFLDACFSGANRDGEMINPSLRGVVIRANAAAPGGNMVVFSAAQGSETAMPYSEESHGMFTYFLLKKLQETKGDVTYEELGDYIRQNVARQSIVLNGKSQTPCVTPSASLGTSWQSWTLK